jgi:hypothetical protein
VLWGPQAGYFARRSRVPLRVAVLPAPEEARFEYAIAMGVRRGDTALRAQLDDVIARRHADLVRILSEYDVPRTGEGEGREVR